MEPYDWSHHDRLRAEELWLDDQRRWDDLRRRTIAEGTRAELGPLGRGLLYAGFLMVAAYFSLILIFGAH